ncbi:MULTISPECIES: hypothetical protein [unclassified Streptomyces]|uniref:hypothetical protein n=1 Tax=unclassified Streptomyces TaxID=2593676 RepID=UPI002DDBB57B|nr:MULTISPECIES: hypothetical protein [unclassified Streptomyces]WSA95291.1 hypothetical protein OIE63_29845 [Streptomyces sp. NBC_01795]WSB79709.1 hypothetical protein OHB04_30955 [Streptomyces sp. NBC_01775]WSS12085.1 hypothetical protein OG533_09255 [Streptomyces sp. NBC_01186]WSS40798.1 hypothetical protein OG220_09415 [Streptomyces sp. NBC_01187]
MTERDPGPDRDPDEGEARHGPSLPPEEEAAWAAIVAAYGPEPADDDAPEAETEAGPSEAARDREPPPADESDGDMLTKPRQAPDAEPPVRSFTVYAAGTAPRDWEADDDEDEGHFVPPEPPPLPQADTTTKFAWLAVLGGPLLLFGAILLQADLTWWIVTLGVGGFLGGFATLVARMRDGRDEDDGDDPGRGAVV